MNLYYPIIFLTTVMVVSCSPQETSEVKREQVKYSEVKKIVVSDNKKKCHSIRIHDTMVINSGGIAPDVMQKFSTDRCFMPDEDKEEIIVYKDGLVIFDKKIKEIRLGTRLYATVCAERLLLAWGGVDPDDLGNLFDYEIYYLLDEQLFIEEGLSRAHPSFNSKCQVVLP